MSELRAGWAITVLQEITAFNPKHSPDINSDTLVSFVPMPAVSEASGEIVSPISRPLSEVARGYTHFRAGDVIFAKITPCMENGKIAVARELENGLGCGSTEFHVLRPQMGISADYIWRFLRQQSIRNEAEASMTGAVGQRRVPTDFLKNSRIPLAPFPEQRRIVAKIDSLSAKSARARDHLDHISRLVEKYKQAILAAAFRGNLVGKWRAIFDSSQQSAIDGLPREVAGWALPDHWRTASISEVAENHDGRRIPVKASERARRPGVFPYYGASGIIDAIDDYLFEGNFLLVGEDGANLLSRSSPIAFLASGKFWVNNHAHVLQARATTSNHWISFYINMIDLSPFVTGTAQPKLTQAALNKILIPIPPIDEQSKIVRRVETAFAWIDRLAAEATSARKLVDRLDQAVLAKAFRGDLVPQDPNDEPATVLLARIRRERAASGPASRRGRRRA